MSAPGQFRRSHAGSLGEGLQDVLAHRVVAHGGGVVEQLRAVEHDADALAQLARIGRAEEGRQLGENIRVMLDSTKLLYDPATMRNYPLSEYILKS